MQRLTVLISFSFACALAACGPGEWTKTSTANDPLENKTSPGPNADPTVDPADPDPTVDPASPADPTTPPPNGVDPANACAAGTWHPGSGTPLPEEYVSCTSNDECINSSYEGCCTQTYIAVRRDSTSCHAFGDGSESCDMECTPHVVITPKGVTGAACVEGRCQLTVAGE